MNDIEEIKSFMRKLISDGVVKGIMGGPKDNVLICDSLKDWCIASGELSKAGYSVSSPGGHGGSAPESRQATHKKVWTNGTLCASVIMKKILIFSLPHTTYDYCDIVSEAKEKS